MRKTVLCVVAGVLVVLVAANSYAVSRDAGILKLAGDDKNTIIELELPNKIKVTITTKGIRFPVGTYIPKSYTIMKRDRSGKVWKMTCGSKLGPVSTFTVEKGETTVLEIAPIIIVKSIRYRSSRGKDGGLTIPIGLSLEGKNGQSYSPSVYMGSRRVPAPQFQILDGNNKVLAQGKFEYG